MGVGQSKDSKHGRSNLQSYASDTSQRDTRLSTFPSNSEKTKAISRVQTKYARIGDDYNTLNEVTEALSNAGLESSNLIIGIDFTQSNEWTGKISYGGRSLHDVSCPSNPYEQAISIIGRTLAVFDEDNLIPCFGFGDASTHDQDVFSFYPDNQPCNGFDEALRRYRELVPDLHLSGPTSFAPIIETAISIVDKSRGQYHILLIIADGQVTRGRDNQLSPQERDTINAIVKASEYPLSIVLVGVGDGPWDMMEKFDDSIPSRAFDNFQFVNFTGIMASQISASRKEAKFALEALMEIPSQYKATVDLQLLGNFRGIPEKVCRPPPVKTRVSTDGNLRNSVEAKSIKCSICSKRPKNLAFQCGHQTCEECGKDLRECMVCKSPISKRIKLC